MQHSSTYVPFDKSAVETLLEDVGFETFALILDSFKESLGQAIAKLQSPDSDLMGDLRYYAHRTKSVAGQVGFTDFQEFCERILQAIPDADTSSIQKLGKDWLAQAQIILVQIDNLKQYISLN